MTTSNAESIGQTARNLLDILWQYDERMDGIPAPLQEAAEALYAALARGGVK